VITDKLDMQTTDIIWHNGQFIPWDDAKVHVLSHTLHYGGGAFEGIRFYNTQKGPAIFRLNEHIKRWFYSANILQMALPFDLKTCVNIIKDLLTLNHIEQGYIRPLAFYGYGHMKVNPLGAPLEVAIACWPWGAYLPYDRVDIKTSRYIRIHPRSTVADAKLCGHYLNGILANLELQGTHYHEALFLDVDGNIAEGAGENFFIVKDGVIYTPKLGSILAGITRNTVMELALQQGYHVIEADLTLADAFAADEAFFTGTAAEVTPIRSIDDSIIGDDSLGPITQVLRSRYLDLVYGKLPEYEHYLTYCK
jgi:branched-chain amino acid aminotransferase